MWITYEGAVPTVVVRRFGAREIARKAAGGRERDNLLGQPANLEGKPRSGKEHVGKAAKREGM